MLFFFFFSHSHPSIFQAPSISFPCYKVLFLCLPFVFPTSLCFLDSILSNIHVSRFLFPVSQFLVVSFSGPLFFFFFLILLTSLHTYLFERLLDIQQSFSSRHQQQKA